ncbi:MAG TPA: ring-opening amidohydrolase [Alphaproteobacteria bacterium]
MTVRVLPIDMASPEDVTGIAAAVAEFGPHRVRRLAVLIKVEGNSAPNDYSCELTRRTLHESFAAAGLAERAISVIAIGCEGIATPFATLLADIEEPSAPTPGPRLALGFGASAPVPVAERGRAGLLPVVSATVGAALGDAGLTPARATLLLVKIPVVHPGVPGATAEQTSMRRGRSLAALGAGIALGDIEPHRVTEAVIGIDGAADLYARRVMTVAAPESDRVEAIALGNNADAGGDLIITATLMADILDGAAVSRMLHESGVALTRWGTVEDPDDVAAVLMKTGVAPDGRVRGHRTMVYSSAMPPESHIRAASSGMLGAILGHSRFFNSGDPIHQAPPGGGIVAAIVRNRA